MQCISSGIPLVLVTCDATMRETFYLLVDKKRGIANEIAYLFVGDQLHVSVQLEEFANI